MATEFVDPAWEYDAPQYYNFKATSPSGSNASAWFAAQEDAQQCFYSPLGEIQNTLGDGSAPGQCGGSAPKPSEPAPEPPSTRARNIVTSWGARPSASAHKGQEQQPPPRSTCKRARGAPTPATAPHTASQRPQGVTLSTSRAKHSAGVQGGAGGKAAAVVAPREEEAAPLETSPDVAPPSKVQRTSEQPRAARTEPRITRSASKAAAAKAHCNNTASSTAKSLRASMAKAQSTHSAPDAAAAQAAPAPKPQGPAAPASAAAQPALPQPAAPAGPSCAAPADAPAHASGSCAAPAPRRQPPGGSKGLGKGSAAAAAAASKLRVAKGSGVAKAKAGKADPARLKKVLRPRKVLPVRSTKPLTLPEEPLLGGANRRVLRSSTAQGAEGGATPYKPLAERVREFSKTPARFKSKPAPAEHFKRLCMTMPKEPCLRTTSRLRPSHFKPHEEEEAEAMAAMPQFHARPLNPHILEAPQPIPETARRHAPIQPQPFTFITDDRMQRRQQQQQGQQQAESPDEGFKALPLNRSILDHPLGLPKRPRMSLTVPKSPLLRTRSRTHEASAQAKAEEPVFKARPVPDFLQVPREFQGGAPKEQQLPLTQLKPFQLRTERRGKQHQERLQSKLAELEAEAAALRMAKAHQVPATLDRPAVPARPEPRPLTVPHPFKLRSEARHEAYVTDFNSHVNEEEQQKQADAEFKARAMWNGLPFRPRESDAPLTAPSQFKLATNARASERQAYDRTIEQKWKAIEEEKAAAEEAARKAEEEAVRQYRRTLRFKAKPAPSHAAPSKPAPAPAKKPLTKPKTPQLGRKRKAEAQ